MTKRTLSFTPNIVGQETAGLSQKRTRICLRCNANLTSKHKCAKCGLRFHDGLILRWLKKVWGIPAR